MIDFLNHWGPVWSSYFGLVIIQNTLFVGLILLVLHAVRNSRAHVKYAVALVGMLKLLVPPFLQLSGLRLPFTVPPTAAQPIAAQTVMSLTMSSTSAGMPEPVAAGTDLSTAGILLSIWMAAVAGYLILSAVSTLRLRWMLRSAVRIDDWRWLPCRRGRALGIYRSNRISMPLTLGVLPGRIFVPVCWDDWSEDCRRTVISHEVAHIERRDGLVQLVEIIIRALYVFHPLVWVLAARLGTYREMACDDVAISRGTRSPVAYSRYLVEIAERLLVNPVGCPSASALVRQRHELMNRVRYQIKEGEMRCSSKRIKWIVVISLLLLVVPLSWYCGRADTEPGGKANSPNAKTAGEAVTGKPGPFEYVELIIGEGRDIKVDGKPVIWEKLAAVLDAEAGENSDQKVVVIRCGKGVKMGTLSGVQNMLVKAGLMKVSYQDAEGNSLALILPGEKQRKSLKQLDPADLVTITVEPTGKINLGGRQVEIPQVGDIVRKHLRRNPHVVFSILTPAETKYVDFHAVLDEVKAAGAKRIAVS